MRLGLVPFVLAACAGGVSRESLPDKARVSKLEALEMPQKAIGLENAGEDTGDDIISTQGRPLFVPTALDNSDPLPSVVVPWMSFVDTPLQDVLQTVVADAHIPLSVVWDNPAAKISRSSVSMINLSGDLTKVLNKLAESYGFFWRYKDNMLHIVADQQYITPVPPIADLFESLPIMVKTLGGTDVFLDKSARLITFRAGSQSFSKIKNYLEITRRDRALIVYDTYIWEVILNDSSKMGIDWGGLQGASPATSLTLGSRSALLTAGVVNATSGGTGLALSFAGSRFSMELLIDFLRGQGTINSLSQPKIQLLSGGKATLRDEIATTYVSRVGSPTISSGTVVPGSVETSQIKTGVSLEITGDVSDGTVYSDIALRVSDLVGMGSATVSGSTISLPKTSSREVFTHVRAKPGDTILLAGVQYDKLNNTNATGFGVLRSKQEDIQRSELIIVMKPRIKHFVPKGEEGTVMRPLAEADKAISSPKELAQTHSNALSKSKLKDSRQREQAAQKPPVDDKASPAPSGTVAGRTEDKLPSEVINEPPLSDRSKLSTKDSNSQTAESPTKPPTVLSNTSPEPKGEKPAPTMTQASPKVIKEVPDTPRKAAARGVYLQFGAFGSEENADNLRSDLEGQLNWLSESGQGLHVVALAAPGGTMLHRVQAGPFSNRKTALKAAEKIKSVIGSPPAVVVR